MAAVLLSVMGMAIELKHIIDMNLVRLGYHITSHCFTFSYSCLKQLYINNKMEQYVHTQGF